MPGGVNVSSDLSGDGVPDLIAKDGGAVYVTSPGLGGGASLTFLAHTLLTPRASSHQGASADWDGDGFQDLAMGARGSAELDLFLGPLVPGVYDHSASDFLFNATGIGAPGDLNGDGMNDLVTVYGDVVSIWDGIVQGTTVLRGTVTESGFSSELMYDTGSYEASNGAEVEDLDGDGLNDLLLADRGSSVTAWKDGAVFVFLGPISGSVTSADFVVSGSTDNETFGRGLSTPDLNADGQPDLVSRSSLGATIFYGPLTTDLDTSQADATTSGFGTSSSYAHHSPGDLNLDGYDDWLIADSTGIYLFLGAEN